MIPVMDVETESQGPQSVNTKVKIQTLMQGQKPHAVPKSVLENMNFFIANKP